MISIRAFIGIDFSKEYKAEILALQQKLKRYALSGRWTYPDNFHLTLQFLGEITAQQQVRIDEKLGQLCTGQAPFQICLTQPDIFGGQDTARVLWLGTGGEPEALRILQTETEKALMPLGFAPEERKYTPHITIGQDIVFTSNFDRIREAIGEVSFQSVRVDRLYLFRSEQIGLKRMYTHAGEYPLAITNNCDLKNL